MVKFFDPEQGYQIEGGVKFQQTDRLQVTVSPFYILKYNTVERNAVNEYNQIGEADSKGIEIDLEANPTRQWFIKAGYAYVDARVRAYDVDSLQATRAGNQLRFSPKHMANFWTSYELKNGLGAGVGANYVGENFTNSNNSYELPAYFTLDATVFFNHKNLRIGLNVNNLLDELYFTDAIYDYQFFVGAGRNFKVSLRYKL